MEQEQALRRIIEGAGLGREAQDVAITAAVLKGVPVGKDYGMRAIKHLRDTGRLDEAIDVAKRLDREYHENFPEDARIDSVFYKNILNDLLDKKMHALEVGGLFREASVVAKEKADLTGAEADLTRAKALETLHYYLDVDDGLRRSWTWPT